MNSLLAKKIEQGQEFLENGSRIPVTRFSVLGNIVTAIKTPEKDQYSAIQLGFEKRKKQAQKTSKSPFRFLREVRLADGDTDVPAVGDIIKATSVFKPGDIVNITGISKGKGYAGGVKRYHFKGGPRTHGQSDRERAPGSIGSNTTPGRVWKGKRMAGHMGTDTVTVKNLKVMFADDNYILVKGLVPGGRNNLLIIKKVGEDKKFVPLYQEETNVSEDAKETKGTEETGVKEEVRENAS